MRRFLLLFLFSLFSLFGQTDRYVLSGAATIGSSDYNITLTLGTTTATSRRFEVESVTVQAVGGEVTVSLERDCSSVPTKTSAITVVAINPASTPAAGAFVKPFADTGATGCTSFSSFGSAKGWKVPDRQMIKLPQGLVYNQGTAASKNINLRMSGNGFTALWQVIVKEDR